MHLFKEVTGTSPYAYVLEQRLIRAAELLLSSDDPVSQISYLVGFSDPLHFSRLFKKKYGLSPEHFRKKQ
jgi:AraC-like DNA-binding protein